MTTKLGAWFRSGAGSKGEGAQRARLIQTLQITPAPETIGPRRGPHLDPVTLQETRVT